MIESSSPDTFAYGATNPDVLPTPELARDHAQTEAWHIMLAALADPRLHEYYQGYLNGYKSDSTARDTSIPSTDEHAAAAHFLELHDATSETWENFKEWIEECTENQKISGRVFLHRYGFIDGLESGNPHANPHLLKALVQKIHDPTQKYTNNPGFIDFYAEEFLNIFASITATFDKNGQPCIDYTDIFNLLEFPFTQKRNQAAEYIECPDLM